MRVILNAKINNGIKNVKQWQKQDIHQKDHMTGINLDARTGLLSTANNNNKKANKNNSQLTPQGVMPEYRLYFIIVITKFFFFFIPRFKIMVVESVCYCATAMEIQAKSLNIAIKFQRK